MSVCKRLERDVKRTLLRPRNPLIMGTEPDLTLSFFPLFFKVQSMKCMYVHFKKNIPFEILPSACGIVIKNKTHFINTSNIMRYVVWGRNSLFFLLPSLGFIKKWLLAGTKRGIGRASFLFIFLKKWKKNMTNSVRTQTKCMQSGIKWAIFLLGKRRTNARSHVAQINTFMRAPKKVWRCSGDSRERKTRENERAWKKNKWPKKCTPGNVQFYSKSFFVIQMNSREGKIKPLFADESFVGGPMNNAKIEVSSSTSSLHVYNTNQRKSNYTPVYTFCYRFLHNALWIYK